MATTLLSRLAGELGDRQAGRLLNELAVLAGLLGVHLAMEDRVVYPALMQHPDPSVSETARRFHLEMGDLQRVFADYRRRWSTVRMLVEGAHAFQTETKEVLSRLMRRIDHEEMCLYPLVTR